LSATSLEFLIALFAGSALVTPLTALNLRRALLTVASALFVWVQSPDWVNVLTLLGFVLSGYVAAQILAWRPSTWFMALYITVLTIAFIVLKRYAFLELVGGEGLLAHAIDLVGLSFIFFRQIHYVVDVRQGEIRQLSLWSYLCYQLNPFTLLAGPIQRYQVFHEDWQELKPRFADEHALRLAFLRILVGVIKVSFIGEAFLQITTGELTPDGTPDWLYRILLFYCFPAYVYFNFAGYCDIVIAGASLFGIRVPENFDKPYLARNMIDFWNRWHRSLTFWIRDYVFTPLYMFIARRWPAIAGSSVFACYFIALFLAGVWHGATWNFVVFGLLNGAGVAAAKVWENILIARGGRQGLKAYLASRPIRWIAGIATINFVCVTQVFLRPGSEDNVIFVLRALANIVGL
jgi:D-alanyl-lipoteichoic acid acyltransferase DltB (MBOAT superfamily)